MAQVGPRKIAAGVTVAGLIDGQRIVLVLSLFDDHSSEVGKQVTVARVARGQDAIHHVQAAGHVFGKLFRHADAHHVTRPVRRQQRRRERGHFEAQRARLADRESADGVASRV